MGSDRPGVVWEADTPKHTRINTVMRQEIVRVLLMPLPPVVVTPTPNLDLNLLDLQASTLGIVAFDCKSGRHPRDNDLITVEEFGRPS